MTSIFWSQLICLLIWSTQRLLLVCTEFLHMPLSSAKTVKNILLLCCTVSAPYKKLRFTQCANASTLVIKHRELSSDSPISSKAQLGIHHQLYSAFRSKTCTVLFAPVPNEPCQVKCCRAAGISIFTRDLITKKKKFMRSAQYSGIPNIFFTILEQHKKI